jgi:hypothetical protein
MPTSVNPEPGIGTMCYAIGWSPRMIDGVANDCDNISARPNLWFDQGRHAWVDHACGMTGTRRMSLARDNVVQDLLRRQ